ncbi:hypothetical protein JW977_02565 [Candidatus Falkowbacteria bacterium]|nr:hypothetical protein [Candidatus Falkowbacteria bacterium]
MSLNPEDAAFNNILEQANTFEKCLEIALQASSSKREDALKKALSFVKYYDEAIYIYMASNDSNLHLVAIKKAIELTDDTTHLDFWIIKAPTDILKKMARDKLKEQKNKSGR